MSPYPDIFTLSISSVVKLDGIMLLSGSDGWIRDYTVETSLDGFSWNLSATVKSSNIVLRYLKLDNGPLDAKNLRVIITAAMNGYSRICELSLVYAAVSKNPSTNNNPLESSTTSTKSSPSPSTTTIPVTLSAPAEAPAPPSSVISEKTKPNTAEIVAGVLAGLAGILLGLQAYILFLLRKKQGDISNTTSTCSTTGVGVERGTAGGGQTVIISDDPSHQKSPIIGFSFRTITASSELRGEHHPELAGRDPRAELA